MLNDVRRIGVCLPLCHYRHIGNGRGIEVEILPARKGITLFDGLGDFRLGNLLPCGNGNLFDYGVAVLKGNLVNRFARDANRIGFRFAFTGRFGIYIKRINADVKFCVAFYGSRQFLIGIKL